MTSSPRSETPPNRFSSVFCAAKAIAIPPMPNPASGVVRLKPRVPRTKKNGENEDCRFEHALAQKHRVSQCPSVRRGRRAGGHFASPLVEIATAANRTRLPPPHQRLADSGVLAARECECKKPEFRGSAYAQQQPKRTDERIPRLRHGMLAISCPAIPGQSQNLNRNPCQESGDRNRQQNCEPLPQGKTQELVAHKNLRKVSFYLVDCGLLVELRKLGQSVRGNEPDSPRVTFGSCG